MNEYVTNGRGTAYDALRAIGVGFWINQDFMEMVEWIRSYNSQHQAADQVRFYGCDMQYPITVLQQLRNGAIQLGHPLSAAGLAGLDILINNINYRKLSDPEIAKVKNAISEIRSDRSADIKRNNEQFYQHEIRTIEQLLEFESASPGKNQFALRDRFMAENSTWIYRHED